MHKIHHYVCVLTGLRLLFYFFYVLSSPIISLWALSLRKILESSSCEFAMSLGQGSIHRAQYRAFHCECRKLQLILLGSELVATQRKSPQVLNSQPFFPGASFYKWYLLTADQVQDHEARNCNDMRLYNSIKGSKWHLKYTTIQEPLWTSLKNAKPTLEMLISWMVHSNVDFLLHLFISKLIFLITSTIQYHLSLLYYLIITYSFDNCYILL